MEMLWDKCLSDYSSNKPLLAFSVHKMLNFLSGSPPLILFIWRLRWVLIQALVISCLDCLLPQIPSNQGPGLNKNAGPCWNIACIAHVVIRHWSFLFTSYYLARTTMFTLRAQRGLFEAVMQSVCQCAVSEGITHLFVTLRTNSMCGQRSINSWHIFWSCEKITIFWQNISRTFETF